MMLLINVRLLWVSLRMLTIDQNNSRVSFRFKLGKRIHILILKILLISLTKVILYKTAKLPQINNLVKVRFMIKKGNQSSPWEIGSQEEFLKTQKKQLWKTGWLWILIPKPKFKMDLSRRRCHFNKILL